MNKEVSFHFDDLCLEAFDTLKQKLISTPIIIAPNWTLDFEIICDHDYVVGIILGKRKKESFPCHALCKQGFE